MNDQPILVTPKWFGDLPHDISGLCQAVQGLIFPIDGEELYGYTIPQDRRRKDPLTTAAAIDRVVHHSIIIEFGREMKSVRAEEAARRNGIRLDSASAVQDAES